jgi:hypothetical protein
VLSKLIDPRSSVRPVPLKKDNKSKAAKLDADSRLYERSVQKRVAEEEAESSGTPRKVSQSF